IGLAYRSGSELADWQKRCPIVRSEAALRAVGLLGDAQLAAMESEIEEEIDAAFSFARDSAFPDASTLMMYTYPD
ncbi:MAG: thiamine pyrophosphate-dependent enzyme, partial [Alphaproteobacteria bacterium]